MCFSPEASFGAAAVISAVGVFSFKKAETKAQKLFATIPLFFALQQVTEGILWIIIPDAGLSELKTILNLTFLSVAWIIWPILIPLSTMLLEPNNKKKKLLTIILGIGIGVAISLLFIILFIPIDSKITDYHIDYTIKINRNIPMLVAVFYTIPTVFSLLISSVKRMWILGAINLSSYIFSKIYFTEQLISVWCFFGAISSALVLFIILRLNSERKIKTS